ncbi:hypothetical protein M5K25_013564 [Dendrobium thyrsiflorum]|uniref:HAT C-terminal dimerisation domain-containing protein n=1 Tax=Dendrobium thyrsiflorum TaxID=117978 RepID=A0ABD0UTB7_DENTH
MEAVKKEMRGRAIQVFSRWMYDSGIPFNTVKYDSFPAMVEALGQFGSDGWMSRNGKSLINFLVNCPRGSAFVESIDASSFSKNAIKMFELFCKYIEVIGPQNMIQVVTDNASENVLAAAHFLNPEYLFNNPDIAKDKEIADGLYQCIGRLSKDVAEEDKISNELSLYIRGEGLFGIPPAVRQRTTRSPVDWRLAYGQGATNLQIFSIEVLSLACSSSGCERNWSIFEHLHSKRRSKLDHDDANEWLTGKLDDESDEENDFIVGEEDLTWTSVAKATGVYDKSYNIRERSKGKEKESSFRHDVAIENEDEEGDEEDYEVGDNADEDNEAFLPFANDDSQEE